jgi:hypothetical protein
MLTLVKLKLVSVLKDLLRTGVAKYLPSWFAPARYLANTASRRTIGVAVECDIFDEKERLISQDKLHPA